MSGVVTAVIILVVLAVVGGGKKYLKKCSCSYTKTNIVFALISAYIIYKIFSSY